MQETRLRDYLATYFRGLDESDESWCTEFALALELLVLYGHIRTEEHPRKGRMLIDARRHLPNPPSASVADILPAEPKSSAWPFAVCAASAVMAAGCTLLLKYTAGRRGSGVPSRSSCVRCSAVAASIPSAPGKRPNK